MRLKKREIGIFRREMNVQEGDRVKKRESPSLRGTLDMYGSILKYGFDSLDFFNIFFTHRYKIIRQFQSKGYKSFQ